MGIKERKNLRVIEGYEGSLKGKIKYYRERLKNKAETENGSAVNNKMQSGKFMSKLGKEQKKRLLIVVTVLVVGIALYFFMNFRTHTAVTVTETIGVAGAADSNYKEFAGGVIKYSKDGISYLDMDGEEQWNLPYQIKTPFVEVHSESAAVACKGGNDIMVFGKDGLKGEIKTTLPIEKLTISEQGIVAAILKNDSAPKVICYDVAGNILVEHDISLSGMGYPMDVAISADGEVLQVSYIYVYEGKLLSKVAYYNFGKAGESVEDHQVGYKEFDNTIVATGFYMDDRTSAVVGDNCMTIFKGNDQIKEVATIVFDKEIQCVGHSDEYIAVVLENSGETGYELRMYNKSGKLVTIESFSGNYRNIKISGNQIIMYDGKECAVFLKNGVQKFCGEMNNNIMEIIPVSGLNRYIVMNANGMENIRLVK